MFHRSHNFRCPLQQVNFAYPFIWFLHSQQITDPDRIPTPLGDSSARARLRSHWIGQIRNATPQSNTQPTRLESRPKIHDSSWHSTSPNYVDLLITSTISKLVREIPFCLKDNQLHTQRGQTTWWNRSDFQNFHNRFQHVVWPVWVSSWFSFKQNGISLTNWA